MTPKVLVPDVLTNWPEVPGIDLVVYDPSKTIPEAHRDAKGIVVWGMSDAGVEALPQALPDVEVVQLLSAGADAAVRAGFKPEVQICSGRSLHDEPVAEHALALILAAARSLNVLMRAQIGHRWAGELGGMQPEPNPERFTTLKDANVTIWGYGSIGRKLATHLEHLGANVTGIASSRREEGSVTVWTPADTPEVLPNTDVLVLILPATPATEKALGADELALLPKHAWVVNVGRGATADEEALIEALQNGTIAGAALDVTAIEPLPPSSKLWDLPNAIITPHAAGGRPRGARELIEKNLAAWLGGEPLQNLVPRS